MTGAGLVVLAACVAVVAGTGRWLAGRWRHRRRRTDRDRRAVEALRALAAELAAGAAPLEALRTVSEDLVDGDDPTSRTLEQAVLNPDESTAAATLRDGPVPGLSALGAAWQVSAETGAPLATSLTRLATAAARSAAAEREVQAVLAGPRVTAVLLAGLPALGLLLASSTGAAPGAFLLGSALGRACLLAGLTLDAAGLFWIERLTTARDP